MVTDSSCSLSLFTDWEETSCTNTCRTQTRVNKLRSQSSVNIFGNSPCSQQRFVIKDGIFLGSYMNRLVQLLLSSWWRYWWIFSSSISFPFVTISVSLNKDKTPHLIFKIYYMVSLLFFFIFLMLSFMRPCLNRILLCLDGLW